MFSIHESTRITLGRAIFLFACLLPACAVTAWAFVWNGAGHRDSALDEIGRALRLSTTCERVSHPWADTLRFHELTIVDPETGIELVRVPELDVVRDEQGILATARECELDARGWDACWTMLRRRLESGVPPETPIRIGIGLVKFRAGRGLSVQIAAIELRRLVVREEATATVRAAQASFALHATDAEPTWMTLRREPRDAELIAAGAATVKAGNETRGELKTGTTACPLALLRPWCDFANCGPTATIAGALRWSESPAGLQAEARAVIENLDVATAIAAPLGQRLSGRGTLELESLTVRAGHLQAARGRFHVGPGEMGAGLFAALRDAWKCRELTPVAADRAASAFDDLAFAFELRPEGVAIRGESRTPGTLLTCAGKPTLGEPTTALGPPGALLGALTPANTPRVPALPNLGRWFDALPPLPAETGR